MFEKIYECEDVIVIMATKQSDYEACTLASPVVKELLELVEV